MSPKSSILLVEDDPDLRSMTQNYLRKSGFNCVAVESKEKAILQCQTHAFDLFILDIMLPQEDGFAIAQKIRETRLSVPIIFLTAFHDLDHKLKAFDIKADDYMTKPFEFKELVARINAQLRKSRSNSTTVDHIIRIGKLSLNTDAGIVNWKNAKQSLKPLEVQVLENLMYNAEKIVPKYMLLEKIWKEDSPNTNANLDVQIHHLRKAIKPFGAYEIETIRGIGFRLKQKNNA